MKPSGNETLHRPDQEMICDKIFSAALPRTEFPQVREMTSQRYASVPFFGTT